MSSSNRIWCPVPTGFYTIDPNGGLHVAYFVESNSITMVNQAIMYINNISGAWTAPQKIIGYSSNTSSDNSLSIAIDPENNWHLVYNTTFMVGDSDTHYLKYVNSYSGKFTLATDSKRIHSPSIAIDPNGGLHVAYFVDSKSGTIPPPPLIYPVINHAIMYMNNVSGAWTTPQKIIGYSDNVWWGGNNNLSIAIDRENNWHLVYRIVFEVDFNTYTDYLKYVNSYSEKYTLATESSKMHTKQNVSPSIAIDSNGGLHVAYFVDSYYGDNYYLVDHAIMYMKTIPKTKTYSISGTISDGISQNVLLALSGDSSSQTTSDSNSDYSFNGLSNGNYTVTPSLENTLTSITTGNLVIFADAITPVTDYTFSPSEIDITISDANQTDVNFTITDKWIASGNVVINNILHASGDLSIDTSMLTVSGNCRLYANNIPIGGINQTINIYNGSFTFDAVTGTTTSINPMFSVFDFSNFDVHIDKVFFSDDEIGIAGDLAWQLSLTPGIKDSGTLTLDLKEFFIDPSGIYLGGRIEIEHDIHLGIGKLKKAYLEYLPSTDKMSGGATVELPTKWEMEADLSFISGKLDLVHGAVDTGGYFLIPPPSPQSIPVIYLKKKLEMEIRELSTSKPIIVLGKLEDDGIPTSGFDAYILTPPIGYDGHDYFPAYLTGGAYYDITGELGIGGKVYVLRDDFELAKAIAKYNFTKGFYAMGELHFYHFYFDDNGQWYYVLLVDGQLKAGNDNFEGLFRGELNIPKNIPVISLIFYPNPFIKYPEPKRIGTKAHIKNQTLTCGVQYGKFKAAAKWDKNGWHIYPGGYDKIQDIHFRKGLRYKAIDQTFIIVDGIQTAIVRFTWASGSPDEIHLSDPTTKEIPQDNSEPDKYLFGRNEELKEICFALFEPQEGQWTFSLDDENIGDYSVELFIANTTPTIKFSSTKERRKDGAGTVILQFNCTDLEDDVEISLYWDEDATGFDGVLITNDLDKSNTSYTWDTSPMPTGTYYIYARVDDGNNQPVYVYAPQRITISNELTVAAPSNITVITNDTSATLSWAAQENVRAYRIYWTDDLAKGIYENSIGIDNINTYTIENLLPGRLYRYAIAAIDEDYNESPPSDPLFLETTLVTTNNPPRLKVPQELAGCVGIEIKGAFHAIDPDGDNINYSLVLAPDGFNMDSIVGTYSWTPTEDYIGINKIAAKASDSNGSEDIRTFKIMVYSEYQNTPPTIVTIPDNIVMVGENYNIKIMAYDEDGECLSYEFKAGPSGMIMTDNSLSWVPNENDIGVHSVKIIVIDTDSAESELAYQLTVLPAIGNIDNTDEDISSDTGSDGGSGCFLSAIK